MGYILYRIETYGIKNISNLVVFDFTSNTVAKGNNKKLSNVKAIYGTNGTGKSAFINSVEIYKELNLDPNYLKQNENIRKINKIINKNKREFYFSIIYGVKDGKKVNVYKHQIEIKMKNDIPYISKEILSVLKDKTINGVYQDIYKVIDGNLELYINEYRGINALIYDKTKNILLGSTLSSLCFSHILAPVVYDIIMDNKINVITEIKSKLLVAILTNNHFTSEITLFLDERDIHNERDLLDIIEYEYNMKNRINVNEDIVSKNRIEEYRKSVKKLYKFIKVFKEDLIDIKIEEREDERNFYCTKKMVYKDYEIDSDYESNGIQKMMKIFSLIEDVTKGKIVFIDELDNNINGVYLNKIIDYLNGLGKGYLCFTCHNLFPMKCLYKYTNSIDFIGETGKVVSWKKNGNYRPYEKYPEGMIIDSPFNIESFDFISVFESEV